ncbi:WSC domain-containing protein 1-like [Eriocheir sinensis]|uniref:WSC domain-containing protein 1-like n=1 Tax=Eriocheir sinensis TaxID=95602 RepID=UPI0021C5C8E8|nr:WSC domain-containing protein 1-like [Eriocheir sinensis]
MCFVQPRLCKARAAAAVVVVVTCGIGTYRSFTRSPLHLEPSPDVCPPANPPNHPLQQRTGQRVQRLPGDVLQVNREGPSWRPWSDSGNCSSYHTRFGRGLTPVLLVSLPCSGSTWLRYMLEGATGLFTGSAYNDPLLHSGGFLGEGVPITPHTTLLHRTHGATIMPFSHDIYARYQSVDPDLPTVLLIRDPARAIISFWKLNNLVGMNKHVEEIPESRFEGEDFRDFVAEATLLWEELAVDRLLWAVKPLFVLHYEDLQASPLPLLRRLLHFLSVPVDEGRLACLVAHPHGSFRRNTSSKFDPFTAEEKKRFAQAVKRVDNLLGLLGYPRVPKPTDRLW